MFHGTFPVLCSCRFLEQGLGTTFTETFIDDIARKRIAID
jgi:hypothetical protein